MIFTDDPVADFERYDAQKEKELEKLPKCGSCGEPIQQETAVFWECGFICDKCLDDCRRNIAE